MRIKNTSERRIGMNTGDGRQVWLEVGVNEVSDADWKAGKRDVQNYLDADQLVEASAKTQVAVAAPAVPAAPPAPVAPVPVVPETKPETDDKGKPKK